MSVLRITYWNADGRFRRKKGKVNGDLPRHLLNGGDKQAHSLTESPVYTQASDPLYLKVPAVNLTWNDLIGTDETEPVAVPQPPTKSEGLEVLVEEGAIWPITPVPFTDTLARQKEQAETHAEALALARAREARSASGDTMLKWAFGVATVVTLLLVLIIALVVIDARWGEQTIVDEVEPETTANVMSTGIEGSRWHLKQKS